MIPGTARAVRREVERCPVEGDRRSSLIGSAVDHRIQLHRRGPRFRGAGAPRDPRVEWSGDWPGAVGGKEDFEAVAPNGQDSVPARAAERIHQYGRSERAVRLERARVDVTPAESGPVRREIQGGRSAFVVVKQDGKRLAGDAVHTGPKVLGGPPLIPLVESPRDVEVGLPARGSAITEEVHRERSEEHTSELQSQSNLVCRLLLEK